MAGTRPSSNEDILKGLPFVVPAAQQFSLAYGRDQPLQRLVPWLNNMRTLLEDPYLEEAVKQQQKRVQQETKDAETKLDDTLFAKMAALSPAQRKEKFPTKLVLVFMKRRVATLEQQERIQNAPSRNPFIPPKVTDRAAYREENTKYPIDEDNILSMKSGFRGVPTDLSADPRLQAAQSILRTPVPTTVAELDKQNEVFHETTACLVELWQRLRDDQTHLVRMCGKIRTGVSDNAKIVLCRRLIAVYGTNGAISRLPSMICPCSDMDCAEAIRDLLHAEMRKFRKPRTILAGLDILTLSQYFGEIEAADRAEADQAEEQRLAKLKKHNRPDKYQTCLGCDGPGCSFVADKVDNGVHQCTGCQNTSELVCRVLCKLCSNIEDVNDIPRECDSCSFRRAGAVADEEEEDKDYVPVDQQEPAEEYEVDEINVAEQLDLVVRDASEQASVDTPKHEKLIQSGIRDRANTDHEALLLFETAVVRFPKYQLLKTEERKQADKVLAEDFDVMVLDQPVGGVKGTKGKGSVATGAKKDGIVKLVGGVESTQGKKSTAKAAKKDGTGKDNGDTIMGGTQGQTKDEEGEACAECGLLDPSGTMDDDSVEWISCNSASCPAAWYHLECTTLREMPEQDEEWWCPKCQSKSRKLDFDFSGPKSEEMFYKNHIHPLVSSFGRKKTLRTQQIAFAPIMEKYKLLLAESQFHQNKSLLKAADYVYNELKKIPKMEDLLAQLADPSDDQSGGRGVGVQGPGIYPARGRDASFRDWIQYERRRRGDDTRLAAICLEELEAAQHALAPGAIETEWMTWLAAEYEREVAKTMQRSAKAKGGYDNRGG